MGPLGTDLRTAETWHGDCSHDLLEIRRTLLEDVAMVDVFRQGDILVSPLGSIPRKAVAVAGLVVATGELTGHSHRIEPAGRARLFRAGEETFLRVLEAPAVLRHEEHGPITLPVGTYRVWRQREYHPEPGRVNPWVTIGD